MRARHANSVANMVIPNVAPPTIAAATANSSANPTLGLLINFNVPHLKEGIRRIVLNHPENRQGGKGTPRGGEFLNR